jgi:hypothetical protein
LKHPRFEISKLLVTYSSLQKDFGIDLRDLPQIMDFNAGLRFQNRF